MKRYVSFGIVAVLITLLSAYMAGAGTPLLIKNSKHDLSGGTGNTYRAASTDPTQGGTSQICVFCHTPHGGNTSAPLWNRATYVTTYGTYTSDVLAGLGYWGAEDPLSGNTHVKTAICLSCHDGTVALGSVANMPKDIPGSFTKIKMGTDKIASTSAGYIGTDLSDDHPVAIRHDNSTINKSDPELKMPTTGSVRLYNMVNGKAAATNPQAPGDYVECTSCHDAHDNQYGKFLVGSNEASGICTSCHRKETGSAVNPAHENATGVNYNPDNSTPAKIGTTVGGVKCMNCHYPHRAGATGSAPDWSPYTNIQGGQYLLTFQEENTCFNTTNRWSKSINVCHDSNATAQGGKDIKSEIDASKSSKHQYPAGAGVHRATEHGKAGAAKYGWLSGNANWHVQCADCHNSHTAGSVNHTPPGNTVATTSPLYGAGGVSVNYPLGNWPTLTSGNFDAFESLGVTDSISMPVNYYEYQICFKCHSSFAWGTGSAPTSPALGGGTAMTDQAVEFNTLNLSFHPVAGPKPGPGTLTGGWVTNQTMYCSDCHGDNTGTIKGPHGSNATIGSGFARAILTANFVDTYATSTNPAQNQPSTDICFNCHDQQTYLTNASDSYNLTGTGFNTNGTSNWNLHLRHRTLAASSSFSNVAYRCVNCHTRIPHGYKNKAMIVLGTDGFPDVAAYAAGGAAKISNATLPAAPPYGVLKTANCTTVAGCH